MHYKREVNKMEKNVEISILCEMYGQLLTEKQYIFLVDYYNNDLSLSEIAENDGITRQAVRDVIKKGENKLFEIEEKLGFMKKTMQQKQQIDVILTELQKIKDTSSDKKMNRILEDVRKKLNHLV